MEAYINGIGIISPQQTFETDAFLETPLYFTAPMIRAIEPSYKEYLNPALARRMGRIIKMSIAASTACLADAKIKMPDAIITGTALGCHEDTEKFLLSILDNDEQFLTPTSFMQSTHNTVSAQIALQLKCMNYNFTYVHKGFSFETALLDGLMTLAEGHDHQLLIGAHDEITEKHFQITSRIGYWKTGEVNSKELIASSTEGSIAGEGAAFFLISDSASDSCYAKIEGLKSWYKPSSVTESKNKIALFLKEKGIRPEEIDAVIYGNNGDVRFDSTYKEVQQDLFPNQTAVYFKHLCGEYQTSAGFALWLASNILKRQTIPPAVCALPTSVHSKPIQHLLIYNHFMNVDHSVFLLSRC